MRLLSGIDVNRGHLDTVHVSLNDIVIPLSRLVRFSGQTVEPYTVLQHSIAAYNVMERLVSDMGGDRDESEYLFGALMHDAHEAFTNDVPSQWKTREFRQMQRELDVMIYRSFRMPLPAYTATAMIQVVDEILLAAEKTVLGVRLNEDWIPPPYALELTEDMLATDDPEELQSVFKCLIAGCQQMRVEEVEYEADGS